MLHQKVDWLTTDIVNKTNLEKYINGTNAALVKRGLKPICVDLLQTAYEPGKTPVSRSLTSSKKGMEMRVYISFI